MTNPKQRGSMNKPSSIPLSLLDIFAPSKVKISARQTAKHFVNHHSFLMLVKKGFSFDRERGEFFVDGQFLKLTLDVLGVKHNYVPGAVYLGNKLKHKAPGECFFALPNDASARSLANLGYGHAMVLPQVCDENLLEVACSIVTAAEGRLVIMGIGSPNQDIVAKTIVELDHQLDVLCVGAAVEFLAGTQKSPPLMVRRFKLEWLWRLVTNFGVTLPRVTTSAAIFLTLVVKAAVKR